MPRFIFLKTPEASREEKELTTSSVEVFDPTALQQVAAMDDKEEAEKKTEDGVKIESIRAELHKPVEEKNEDILALEKDSSDLDGSRRMEKLFKLKNTPEKSERIMKVLEWMIQTGKGQPVNMMYFACKALSEGVISSHERGRLEEQANHFPPVLFLKEIEKEADLSHVIQSMDPRTFQNFYWTRIMGDKNVREQTEKAMADGQMDHDQVGFIAPTISLESTKKFLTASTVPTAINNFYAGTIKAIEENKENPDMAVELLINFLMTERYVGGMDKKSLRVKPRMAMATNHPRQTMAELGRTMWKALEKLDKKLARFLQKREMNIFEIKDHLKDEYGMEVNSVTEIYDKIQIIVKKMAARKSSSFFGGSGWKAFQKSLS